MTNNEKFSKWALGYSGCDGGDIGTPEKPSLWFCGIEWGGGYPNNVEELIKIFSQNVEKPPKGHEDWIDEQGKHHQAWEVNLDYIYNRQCMKLLSAFEGGNVEDYKKFAKEKKPFTEESYGYFKINLYPLAFKNTSSFHWKDGFSDATGIETKNDYIQFIRNNRFPVMYSWVKQHRPKVIICTGKTYENDFISAFSDEKIQLTTEIIGERNMQWGVNTFGTIIFIIPFMVNRYGLNKNETIQKFGERMKAIMESLEK